MSPMPPPTRLRVRACFLSDIHLGFRGCRAEYLLDFLKSIECDTLYLAGDIVDLWSLKRSVYWPKAHHEVLRALLERARGGTRVAMPAETTTGRFASFTAGCSGRCKS